ncbi:hypothetical protein FDECE_7093 [Fusarium decemcellulare]|nr:hypothetical protein FDECE_7093 [Fusarium decemcellulare]
MANYQSSEYCMANFAGTTNYSLPTLPPSENHFHASTQGAQPNNLSMSRTGALACGDAPSQRLNGSQSSIKIPIKGIIHGAVQPLYSELVPKTLGNAPISLPGAQAPPHTLAGNSALGAQLPLAAQQILGPNNVPTSQHFPPSFPRPAEPLFGAHGQQAFMTLPGCDIPIPVQVDYSQASKKRGEKRKRNAVASEKHRKNKEVKYQEIEAQLKELREEREKMRLQIEELEQKREETMTMEAEIEELKRERYHCLEVLNLVNHLTQTPPTRSLVAELQDLMLLISSSYPSTGQPPTEHRRSHGPLYPSNGIPMTPPMEVLPPQGGGGYGMLQQAPCTAPARDEAAHALLDLARSQYDKSVPV